MLHHRLARARAVHTDMGIRSNFVSLHPYFKVHFRETGSGQGDVPAIRQENGDREGKPVLQLQHQW